MRHFALCLLLTPLVLLDARARAASFPGNLGTAEINRIVEVIGIGSASRLLRSAEPYDLWPGLKIGLEVPLIASRDLNDIGDGTGSLAGLNIVPRLYLAKGLFADLEFIFNYFPSSVFNAVSTLGGMLKWTAYHEQQGWLSTAFYVGLTGVTAFNKTYSGTDEELGVEVSRDYVRMKPFAGLGLLFAQGSVNPSLARTSTNSGSNSTFHVFLGSEIEMPAQFSFQIDMFNLSPGASIFVGKHFF